MARLCKLVIGTVFFSFNGRRSVAVPISHLSLPPFFQFTFLKLLDDFDASHVRAKRFRNDHAAVRLLIVLEDSRVGSANSKT